MSRPASHQRKRTARTHLAIAVRRLSLVLGTVTIGALCSPDVLGAREQVRLRASFAPDRLGASTTITFGFTVTTSTGAAPSPLESMQLFLPAGMGVISSTLGLANCDPGVLLREGPSGCSPNARLGYGTAEAIVPASPETLLERAKVTAMAGLPNDEHLEILFYAEAFSPVAAQLVFPGSLVLESAGRVYSGSLLTRIPLVPTWPGGPDVAVTHMSSTIGPAGLTYTRRAHGRLVRFHPTGISVPSRCPKRGFPFAATLEFQDSTTSSTTTHVPCPSKRH
ncbi:MAG TPA: hypothetical protein VID48_00995 [Solirubrobacteraceae bacterium]|jgi:hypothetical protein